MLSLKTVFLERVIPGPTTMLIGWGVRSVVKTEFLSLQGALIALLTWVSRIMKNPFL